MCGITNWLHNFQRCAPTGFSYIWFARPYGNMQVGAQAIEVATCVPSPHPAGDVLTEPWLALYRTCTCPRKPGHVPGSTGVKHTNKRPLPEFGHCAKPAAGERHSNSGVRWFASGAPQSDCISSLLKSVVISRAANRVVPSTLSDIRRI